MKLSESALDPDAAAAALPSPVGPEPSEIYDLSGLLLTSPGPTANLVTVVINKEDRERRPARPRAS